MHAYLVLLRGVNVGGNNRLSMAVLTERLTAIGFSDVSTYIASGNVLLRSVESAAEIGRRVESVLAKELDNAAESVKALVLNRARLADVVADRPARFGDDPNTYHSDAIFLMGVKADAAVAAFDPREGVDRIWPGRDVIYAQRLNAQRSKSRLSSVLTSPLYSSMTIRSWSTTMHLHERLEKLATTA